MRRMTGAEWVLTTGSLIVIAYTITAAEQIPRMLGVALILTIGAVSSGLWYRRVTAISRARKRRISHSDYLSND